MFYGMLQICSPSMHYQSVLLARVVTDDPKFVTKVTCILVAKYMTNNSRDGISNSHIIGNWCIDSEDSK